MPLSLIGVLLFSIITIVANDSFPQSEKEMKWTNHTSNHHNIYIEYPSDWTVTEGQESRFDPYEELHIDFDKVTMNYSDFWEGKLFIRNVDMPNGPEEYLKQHLTSLGTNDDDTFFTKNVTSIEPHPSKINGELAYSVLYGLYFKDVDYDPKAIEGGIEIATMHKGIGHLINIETYPDDHFDSSEFIKIREKMVNSIKWLS